VRKGDESIEKQVFDCNPQEARGEQDRSKFGKGPILRKNKNAAKQVETLTEWWAAVRWRYFTNGIVLNGKRRSAATITVTASGTVTPN
jgi:hypothetical protein